MICSTLLTKAFLPAISATALIFMYWLSTFMSESRGMETNELGPLLGLISTRIVSVLKPEILSTPP